MSYIEEVKFNQRIYEIVKSHNIDALKELFPSAKKMVSYSNEVLPYPHKKDSILAILAKTSDEVFFNEFWNAYFPFDKNESYEFGIEFLKGTDALGNKINYHYFKDSLPEQEKYDAKIFMCSDQTKKLILENKKNLIQVDKRTDEDRVKARFYYSLREKYVMLGGEAYPIDSNSVLVNKNNELKEYIDGKDFTLIRNYNKISKLELRHLPKVNNKWDFSSSVSDIDLNKSFLKQVFNKLDYPDLFFSPMYRAIILELEKSFHKMPDNEKDHNLYKFMAVNKDTLVIENGINKEHNVNSESYYGLRNNSERKTYFNAEMIYKSKKDIYVTTLHETTHGLDYFNKTISTYNVFVSPAMVFLVLERDIGVLQDKKLQTLADNVKSYKNTFDWPLEMLPRLMAEDYGSDNLADASVKLVKMINEYSNKGYKSLLSRFHFQADEVSKLYEDFCDEYLASRSDKKAQKGSFEDAIESMISKDTYTKMKKYIAGKYGEFNAGNMKKDLENRIEKVYSDIKRYNQAFLENEDLKKYDIGTSLYRAEKLLVSDDEYIENFYHKEAVKTQNFYNEKGVFVPQRFYDELSRLTTKAEQAKNSDEKRAETARAYIILSETYKKLGLKQEKKMDITKMNISFADERGVHKLLKNLYKKMPSIRAEINRTIPLNISNSKER